MQKKRSRNPELVAFGSWLLELRGEMSRERVSQRLADKGVSLGGSTLAQYEKGTVWAPDVGVLLALSQIYEVSFELLARAVNENRKNARLEKAVLLDLIRHDRDQSSDLPGGGSDGPAAAASARVQQRYDELLAAATDVAFELSTMLAKRGVNVTALANDAATGARQPPVRKRARKTG